MSEGVPKFPTPKQKKFSFENKEPRFTDEETNLELKERIAQYADYVQQQIEAYLNLDTGHFGDEVRYGLCPKGGIGTFVEKTTGYGRLYRLRGIYLEEEIIDELNEMGDKLYALYPPVIAHEMCHDFEYSQERYDDYYAPFQNIYSKDHFDFHLDELKIDKKSFGILKGINLEFPGHRAAEKPRSLFVGYLFWNKVELERFEGYAERGEVEEIIGEDTNEKLVLKFARSIARIRYVLENLDFIDENQKRKSATELAAYEQEVRRFLESRGIYNDPEFKGTVDRFSEFLRQEQ